MSGEPSTFLVVASAVLICTIGADYAQAYLDPGVGSYALQLILAGLFASLFFVKRIWNGISVFFRAVPNPRPDSTDSAAGGDPDPSKSRAGSAPDSDNEEKSDSK